MTKYYHDEHPQLRNNNIREAICDDHNRLWIRSFGGYISMIDEKQGWHYINIYEQGKKVPIFNVIKTKSRGIVLFQGSKQFISKPGNDTSFRRWHFTADSVFEQRLHYYNYLSPDEVLWTGTDEFFIMDYRRGIVTERIKVPGITSASAYSKDEIYITTSETGGLYRYNTKTKQLTLLAGLKDQYGKNLFSSLHMISRMADSRMIITSAFAGIYLYDPASSKLVRYMHDPLNRRSVSMNNYHNLICDSSGYVLIASPTNGLSYFNVNRKPASWVSAIKDKDGFVFDGYVNAIAPSPSKDAFWMGGYNQFFLWNKTTGIATFFDYGENEKGVSNRGNDEVTSICTDKNNNVWVGTDNNGLAVLNKSGSLIKKITNNPPRSFLCSNSINNILEHKDTIWVSTSNGVCVFDAKTFQPINFPNRNPLRFLDKKECGKLWMDGKGRLWIGTVREGAFCFDRSTGSLFNIGKLTDGGTVEVFAFTEDRDGLIYLGTAAGMMVLQNDKVIALYNKEAGFSSDRCENLLRDNKGNIWIDNHSTVIRFSPGKKTFDVFDEKAGLSLAGIRQGSAYNDPEGIFYFGNQTGFSFFHPDSLTQPQSIFRLSVTRIENEGQTLTVIANEPIELPSYSNDIFLHLSAIDLDQSKNIFYRYRLKGFDEDWINEPNISGVRYNGLNPGEYKFELQASGDGIHWVTALYPVNLVIKPAYWQTWWFRVGTALVLAILIYFILKRREKIIQTQAQEKAKMEEMRSQALQYQLEIEQVINYFAYSLSGLNSVDDVLWDVVKTCISQLGFQDCVIYLFNPDKTLLIQKAAYGPKNIDYTDIYNRVEVMPGSGIVGHVAVTGVSEIINDTSMDSRYIIDDAARLSEIAVPLMGSNGIIGVIDSEHPDLGFYNNRHLQILTAIGNMVVNKIEQVQAEANSRNKEVEMARLQRDVATLQLTATRAQMNPHFIFNALNSVQQYILKGNTDEANKYLSRFSKLQREILNHCDKSFIPLQKEIEMLRIYLQLEQLRFNDSFDFEISLDKDLDSEEIKIPPMILQPFVENAIWHGLMPKSGPRHVSIGFHLEEEDDLLYCSICDNGIGRKASENNKINGSRDKDHVSKGLSLVYQRLELLQEQMGRSFSTRITDLVDDSGHAAGTRVDVVMFTGY